ncbi:MAG: NADH-quinone oxidoreductase subunit A [Blastochloris sp.]|nr:NADH-quinone oxidoreductase subunit A [Blastochloris sp.]
MIQDYLPVLFQLALALAVAVGGVTASIIIGKRGRRSKAKDAAYECGKDPIGGSQARFSVKFYLVAMIFILFDIEVIFMYPWAVSFRELIATVGMGPLWAMLFFVVLLEIGHLYAYKKGVFDWNRSA